MRKVLNTLVAASLLTALALPVASYGDELEPDTGYSDVPGNQHDQEEIDHRHTEIEQIHKDYLGVLLPPVVIRVGQASDPNIFVLPNTLDGKAIVPGMGSDKNVNLEKLGPLEDGQRAILNPYQNAPITIDSLVLTTETPTDEFIDGARVFGVALGFAALGLLALTGLNSLQNRKRRTARLSSPEQ